MEKRIETYEKARAKHPERWSKNIINWSLPEYVSLNPISEEEAYNILQETEFKYIRLGESKH